MSEKMYGFQQHLGTHDVLVQLQELVIKKATRNSPHGILALDLKGAFDNVSHPSVLGNLKKTGCGQRTFGYVKDFLSKRTAVIQVGGETSDPIELGDRGTPQGSVLSPLLFNLAHLPLSNLLEQIDGVDDAFYDDDIMVWMSHAGSEAWTEEVLQRAATTVHEYAKTAGCAAHP